MREKNENGDKMTAFKTDGDTNVPIRVNIVLQHRQGKIIDRDCMLVSMEGGIRNTLSAAMPLLRSIKPH